MDTVPKIWHTIQKLIYRELPSMRFQMDCNDNLAYEDFLQNFVLYGNAQILTWLAQSTLIPMKNSQYK